MIGALLPFAVLTATMSPFTMPAYLHRDIRPQRRGYPSQLWVSDGYGHKGRYRLARRAHNRRQRQARRIQRSHR